MRLKPVRPGQRLQRAQFASGTQVTITLNGKELYGHHPERWQLDNHRTGRRRGHPPTDGASYRVSVSARDSAGNNASAMHTISVDTTAPVVSIGKLVV